MRSVWDHPRNITDDQARACAATGGVVGITGVGIFLGPNTPTPKRWRVTWARRESWPSTAVVAHAAFDQRFPTRGIPICR